MDADPRIRTPNDGAVEVGRDFVLYWMIGARRASHNFALDRAVDLARSLRKPLLVFEPLRAGYRWASDRLHAFALEGMRDNAAAFASMGIAYIPYVEPEPGAGRGLLAALAKDAAVVVTDDALGFFQPHMIAAAARRIDVRLEVVDGNGLLPIRAMTRAWPTAYAFRRALQRTLPAHLAHTPRAHPLEGARTAAYEVPAAIAARFRLRGGVDLRDDDIDALCAALPIDHGVARVRSMRGGSVAARARLAAFVDVDGGLARYHLRSHPDEDAQSGLSPWLHFGHIGAHEVFAAVAARESWSPARAGNVVDGSKAGFWGMSENAEAFLDELVTWRELSLNAAVFDPAFDSFAGVPAWARATLAQHASDPRPALADRATLIAAQTSDDVWNAAQRQLVDDGVLHNYLRMLWGKKVLEWSPSPEHAFATLVDFNNRFALDGRDANSYAGISWCFGKLDRPWAPERAIFGSVRFMSSANTKKKLHMKRWLADHRGR